MRFERKYRIESVDYQTTLQTIMSINGAFEKTYEDRWVNSIYLDSLDYDALRENLGGISERSKFRLRWYGEQYSRLSNPILEEKIKVNMLGYKKYVSLNSFDLNPIDLEKALAEEILKDKNLHPVVMVRYLRTYLESYDRLVRITIDRELEYRAVNNYHINPFHVEDRAVVLEVKYDQEMEEEIDYILQSIPFRLTKNSKFVEGMLGHWT